MNQWGPNKKSVNESKKGSISKVVVSTKPKKEESNDVLSEGSKLKTDFKLTNTLINNPLENIMSEQGNLKSIQSMMDGYNPYKQRLDETRQLVTKWGQLDYLKN